MSENRHPKSAYRSRNNVSGVKNKGLLNQRPKPDDPESGHGEHVIEHMLRYVDRFLSTKPGTPAARVALDAWQADHFRVREAVV